MAVSIIAYPAPPGAFPPNQWQTQGAQIVPTSPQVVISQTTTLTKLTVSNQNTVAVTLLLTDNSTNGVSGAGAQIVPSISIPAQSIDVIDLGGVLAVNGCSWSASSANSLNVWIRGAF